MKLRNPFSEKTRRIYDFIRNCQDCGRCDLPLSIHHIMGRVSSSPLNSIILCDPCHTSGSYETKSRYLVQSIKFLLDNDYQLTQYDIELFDKHKDMYKEKRSIRPLSES